MLMNFGLNDVEKEISEKMFRHAKVSQVLMTTLKASKETHSG